VQQAGERLPACVSGDFPCQTRPFAKPINRENRVACAAAVAVTEQADGIKSIRIPLLEEMQNQDRHWINLAHAVSDSRPHTRPTSTPAPPTMQTLSATLDRLASVCM